MFTKKVDECKDQLYDCLDVDTVIVQCDVPTNDAVIRVAELSATVQLIDQLTGKVEMEYPVVECLKQLTLLSSRIRWRFNDPNMDLPKLRAHVKYLLNDAHDHMDTCLELLRKRLMLEPKHDKEMAKRLGLR